MHARCLLLGLLVPLTMTGCYSASRMNRYVAAEIESAAHAEKGISAETAADAAGVMQPPSLPEGTSLKLDRQTVLSLATEYSRNLQSRRDDLYRAGLSLFGARRNFGFEVSGTISYIMAGGDEAEDRDAAEFAATIERILPTGGRLQLSGGQQSIEEGDRERVDSASARIRLDQPLLAGAGYSASHEELIQAERDFTYALRSFTLERQDFAIETLREYYNLLGQRKVLENTRTNYQQFVFLRERSEALFKVNRAPAIDVLRSQQEELSAMNRLTTSEESYRIRIGRFLVLLGLPPDLPAELADDIPELRRVELDETRAVAMALERRLDLHTTRDRLNDARRKLDVARNQYLPDVSVFGESDWRDNDSGSDDGTNASSSASTWQAGVRAEIPFDRREERDAIRSAELAVQAATRTLDEAMESITLDVREAYSRLRSLNVSVEVALKNIEIAQKRATNALLEFRNGRLSNRDVVEAANGLLDARNAYVNALADYEIQRLTLLRQVGLLDIARDGAIMELSPDA